MGWSGTISIKRGDKDLRKGCCDDRFGSCPKTRVRQIAPIAWFHLTFPNPWGHRGYDGGSATPGHLRQGLQRSAKAEPAVWAGGRTGGKFKTAGRAGRLRSMHIID